MDRASASISVDLGFDSVSGQTNDLKICVRIFPFGSSASRGTVGSKPASMLFVSLGKALNAYDNVKLNWSGFLTTENKRKRFIRKVALNKLSLDRFHSKLIQLGYNFC